ncbi:S-adenosylmethionine decarboxylase [Lipomyces orientalis]|uniref:S-adenosylmethionine decarboxylase n=1 Tax=Lipomyces orientalis TaxID=1233043 RepID=A0ACC3TE10_9ASCO
MVSPTSVSISDEHNRVPVQNDENTYTVNRDASVTLDSTKAFEGPEKLLEVWFAPDRYHLPPSMARDGLKSVPREMWEDMLRLVHCKVLSFIGTAEMDAYLLSESSMFVFPHKLILKTCGTTTLLAGLPRLLDIARTQTGYPAGMEPWRVFYSRKNFMFPDQQKHPHRSWKDEVKYLDAHFSNGSAYMVGRMNSDHHWYLYSAKRDATSSVNADSSVVNSVIADGRFEDETLEIIMTGLDQKKAAQFYNDRTVPETASDSSNSSAVSEDLDPGHVGGAEITNKCGLANLYPFSRIDSFSFSPCGYSANGVTDATHNYFTVHVTPEPGCSYASFESNVPSSVAGINSLDVVSYVVGIFGPSQFSVTMFETRATKNSFVNACTKGLPPSEIPGYTRVDRIVYELDEYDLVFLAFEKTEA